MEIITYSEAIKLLKHGYQIWHIRYYPTYLKEYPDAGYFVVYPGKDWQNKSSHMALIEANIDNAIAEVRYEIRQRKKDGHPTYIKELKLETLLTLKKEGSQNG